MVSRDHYVAYIARKRFGVAPSLTLSQLSVWEHRRLPVGIWGHSPRRNCIWSS